MATEQGIVIQTGTGTAVVKTTQSSACEGCASKGSCTSQGSDMEVEALNLAGAKAGDRILLSFDTSPLLKATFLIYVFPILCMIAGAAVGHHLAPKLDLNPSGFSAAAGFLFFIIAVFFVKIRGNKLAEKDEYKPKIIRILRRS